jgi:hypothetical protein
MTSLSVLTRAICALALCSVGAAQAHGAAQRGQRPSSSVGASFDAASAASTLPFVVSVAAPAVLLSAGASLVVVSVTAAAEGSVWLLERASDGARFSITLSGQVVGGASQWAGAAVVVAAISTGWVLSVAGELLAFVPNAVGQALFHNERLTHSTPRGVQ